MTSLFKKKKKDYHFSYVLWLIFSFLTFKVSGYLAILVFRVGNAYFLLALMTGTICEFVILVLVCA